MDNKKKTVLLLGFGRVGRIFFYLMNKEIQNNAYSFSFMDMYPPKKEEFPFTIYKNITKLEKKVEDLDAKFLDSFDIVINFLPCIQSLKIIKLILQTETCNFFDLSSFDSEKNEQFIFRECKNLEHRLIVTLCGIAPGLDNLMVRKMINDKLVQKSICVCLLENGNGGKSAWCKVDDYLGVVDTPLTFESGEWKTHPFFTSHEELLFHCPRKEFGANSEGMIKKPFYRAFNEEILSLANNFPNYDYELKVGGGDYVRELKKIIKQQNPNCNDFEGIEDLTASNIPKIEKVEMLGEKGNKGEPDGVFGIQVRTDLATFEIVFPDTKELQERDLPGNYITYWTAMMLFLFIQKCFLEKELKGFYFPETLPIEYVEGILESIGKHANYYGIEKKDK